MTGLAIGIGIESHLAIVPMIITVGMGMIPGGTTGDMIGRGVGNALERQSNCQNGYE
jgi:hypothetical protein